MKIRDHASQFTVCVFSRDIDQGAGVKVALSRAGYDAYFFEDADTFLSRVQEREPHLVLLRTTDVAGSFSDFVEKLLGINREIRFIVWAPADQVEVLAAYNDYGLVDVLPIDPQGLIARSLFAVDRACEALYWQFQNEQLFDTLQVEKERADKAESSAQTSHLAATRQGPPLDLRIKEYKTAASKEELLQVFMNHLKFVPCAYFKFLPTVRSLVVTHASIADAGRLQGVGCQLTPEESKDFGTQVMLGVVPPSLSHVLKQAFQFPAARLHPVFVHHRLEGIVASNGATNGEGLHRLEDEFALMSMAYANLSMEKRLDTLEVVDPVTELYNRKFYLNRLSEEWVRARRIQQPLSVVKIALDDFFELEQAMGETSRDQILHSLAQVILKSSRANDLACRTGQNEISLILPHCHRQGAMVRAERLRRFAENTQMLDNGLKVSISLGISEYPSLCSNADSLDETAQKALQHISEKGGNRLCLYKAPADHQPEFAVTVGSAG